MKTKEDNITARSAAVGGLLYSSLVVERHLVDEECSVHWDIPLTTGHCPWRRRNEMAAVSDKRTLFPDTDDADKDHRTLECIAGSEYRKQKTELICNIHGNRVQIRAREMISTVFRGNGQVSQKTLVKNRCHSCLWSPSQCRYDHCRKC